MRMPTLQPASDSIPLFAREVISLYAEAMPEVRFPDLDLEVLESTAAELRTALLSVERATAELAAARSAAQQYSELLEVRTARALSYARVFAEGNALLTERIVALGRSESATVAQSPPPKKRGRPKKNPTADTSLFEAEPVSGAQGIGTAA
jgi:hypothetical protein